MLPLLLALFLILLTLALLKYWMWERSTFVRTIDLIPGPKKLPIVGNIFDVPLKRGELLDLLQDKWIKDYGEIYRLWSGPTPGVIIASPDLIEKIVTSNVFLDKGEFYDSLVPFLGRGLLSATEKKWRKNRRLLTPAFHFKILDTFFDVFNRNAHILCQQLSIAIKNENSKEVDISKFLMSAGLDIICETSMGIEINAQTKETEFPASVKRAMVIVCHKVFSYWNLLPDWVYNMTEKGKELERHEKVIRDFTSNVIKQRKIEMEKEFSEVERDLPNNDKEEDETGLKKRRTFLDLLLIAKREGADLTDDEIHEEVSTFLIAGHETTAGSAVWFTYCMATNPEHQELVREELNEVFGDSDDPCTVEIAAKLKYLECCIKEAMRLYPVASNIQRYISEDMELGGYKLPAGTSVSCLLYAVHRNEKYFEDPSTFKPERFQDCKSPGGHNYAFLPFSAGPRNCIGQKFALYELKVMLSALFRKFRFSYDMAKHGPPKPCIDILLKPLDDIYIQITPL